MSTRGADRSPGLALLTSPVRRAIVDALAKHSDTDGGALTIDQLAEALDLHRTTVRFHLDQLAEAGLVSAEFTRRFGVGRPRKIYRLAPGSWAEAQGDDALRLLSELLAESFGQPELTPHVAGERWVDQHLAGAEVPPPAQTLEAWLGKVARMLDVLQVWGYTPDISTSEAGQSVCIHLSDCPLMSLAESNPAVVCGIHRGLISGSLKRLGEPDTEVSLRPFVGPGLCQAQVRLGHALGGATTHSPSPTTKDPS